MLLAFAIFVSGRNAIAQAHPTGASRLRAEVELEINVQPQHCSSCSRNGNAIGPAVFGAVGVTLPAGFAVMLGGRAFQEYNTEHSQHSRYALLLGQYTRRKLPGLTLNFGGGRVRHDGDPTDADRNSGAGAVFSGGLALRIPAQRRVGFTIATNLLKEVGGSSDFRPATFTLGFGLTLRACRMNRC